jgi:RNA polymerase sigma-B factor
MATSCVSTRQDSALHEEMSCTAPVQSAQPAHENGVRPARAAGKTRKLQWDKRRTAELFRRCRATNDVVARDELITMYLNLVRYLASKYRGRGEPMDDLIQVGTIGLIKAVDRFDTGRGLEFTTYATPTIIGEIKRHFRDKSWAIKVPRRLQELSAKVSGVIDTLTSEHQCSPTIPQIAARLGVSCDDVLEAIDASAAHNTSPLDITSGRGKGEPFSLLEVIGEHDPLLGVVEDRQTLAAVLRDVPPIAQKALHLRFFEGATQSAIAEELGVSQMQVSRLLRKTLEALRANIVSRADQYS